MALEGLGDVARLLSAADTAVRAKVYASPGMRLDYDHLGTGHSLGRTSVSLVVSGGGLAH